MRDNQYRSYPQAGASMEDSSFHLPVIDVREILTVYARKWWVIALCVSLAAGAAAYYLYQQPRLFESKAVIHVGQELERVVEIQSVTPDDFRDLMELKTVEQSLASDAVMLRVALANGLGDDSTFVGRDVATAPATDLELIKILRGRVTATLRRGTRLIDLSVRDTDPERAKRVAESFVDQFIEMNYEQQLGATRRAKMALVEEAERLKANLAESERRLQAYREQHPDLPTDGGGGIVHDKLNALNTQLSGVRSERLRLETEVEKLERIDPNDAETILSLGTVAQAAEVVDLQKIINQKEAAFAKIKKRYLYKHPTFISAESELLDLHESLKKAAVSVGSNLRKRHEAAIENEAKLAAALNAQNQMALKVDSQLIDYNTLAREVESDQVLHKSVVTRIKETDVTEGLKSGHLRLAVTPMVSDEPVSPRTKLTMAVAIVFGGAIGAVLVLCFHFYEGTLISSPQLERVLGLPALANVPEGRFSKNGDSLVIYSDPQSPTAEAFRTLRSSLDFLGNGHSARSVLVTSSSANEGKSFCAANYALALASQGYKTLLIDADLRRPTIGGLLLGGDDGGPGLSDYLEGRVDAGQACRRMSVPNLYVMPAGTWKPNPAELLGGQKIISLVHESYQWFDRVIIDTSPLGIVTDSLPLARAVDAAVLVVRSGKTSQREVVRTAKHLEMAGAPLAGFALNRVRQEISSKSYYYHHDGAAEASQAPASTAFATRIHG